MLSRAGTSRCRSGLRSLLAVGLSLFLAQAVAQDGDAARNLLMQSAEALGGYERLLELDNLVMTGFGQRYAANGALSADPKAPPKWQLVADAERVFDLRQLVSMNRERNDNMFPFAARFGHAMNRSNQVQTGAEALDHPLPAVLAALDSGQLSRYVTDFPTPEIKDHAAVIGLPHLGASTAEAEENCAVMVANNLREFLENGNIVHSVNFPEAVLPRTRPHRLVISNANVPNMVGQVSTALGEQGLNIADLLNVSKGDVAHTLLDLDGAANEATLERIRGINGILSVRVLPVVGEC